MTTLVARMAPASASNDARTRESVRVSVVLRCRCVGEAIASARRGVHARELDASLAFQTTFLNDDAHDGRVLSSMATGVRRVM